MDERVEKEISFKSNVFITDWKATLVELGDPAQFRTDKLVSLKEASRAASQMPILLIQILYCYDGNTLRKENFAKRIFISFVNIPRTLVTFHADVLKFLKLFWDQYGLMISWKFIVFAAIKVMMFLLHLRLPLSYTVELVL